MDAKEAIKVVKSIKQATQDYYDRHKGFYNTADAKEDVEKELAGINVAISALEKQIPKEPIFDSGNRLCGECSEIIKAYESHCPFCGQAIKKE